MKVLVLDGFKENATYPDKIYKNIVNAFGMTYEVKRIELNKKNIQPCTGCFGCWMKKPGRCLIEDDSQKIVSDIVNSNIIVYFTPVTFGGYSSTLKKLLDRSICMVSPQFIKINGEMHHKKRYDKYPCIIGIGFMENYDKNQSENFKNLIYRNSLNLHSPSQCADVILKDDAEDKIKSKLCALIKSIEVN